MGGAFTDKDVPPRKDKFTYRQAEREAVKPEELFRHLTGGRRILIANRLNVALTCSKLDAQASGWGLDA
jgi:hypothetical protein